MTLLEQKARHRYTPEEDNLIFARVMEAKALGLDLSAIFIAVAEELGGDRSDNGVKQRWGKLSRLYKRGDWKPTNELEQEKLDLDGEKNDDHQEQPVLSRQKSDIEVVQEQVNTPVAVETNTRTECDTLKERIRVLEEQLALCVEERDLYKSERDVYMNERDFYRNERDAYKTESERVRESMKKLLDH